ncbi:DUF2806 domain-containing protein [Bacteroidota bacterium]
MNAVDKLSDIVKNSLGYIFEPGMKTRLLKAEARGEVKAEIEKVKGIESLGKTYESLPIKEEYKKHLYSQSLKRIGFTLIKEQENINDVLEGAFKELEGEQASDEVVDEDWINSFFSHAKNISNEEMQIIWSKILASEIVNPSSYSLITLNVLKSIDKRIANIFMNVARYVVQTPNSAIVPSKIYDRSKKPFAFSDIIELDSVGLLNQSTSTFLNFNRSVNPLSLYFLNNKKVIIVQPTLINQFKINGYILSKAGRELINLLQIECDDSFINQFISFLYKKNKVFDILLADFVGYDGSKVYYENEHPYPNPNM